MLVQLLPPGAPPAERDVRGEGEDEQEPATGEDPEAPPKED